MALSSGSGEPIRFHPGHDKLGGNADGAPYFTCTPKNSLTIGATNNYSVSYNPSPSVNPKYPRPECLRLSEPAILDEKNYVGEHENNCDLSFSVLRERFKTGLDQFNDRNVLLKTLASSKVPPIFEGKKMSSDTLSGSDDFAKCDKTIRGVCETSESNKFQVLKKNLTHFGNSIRKDVLLWRKQVNIFTKTTTRVEHFLKRNYDENELYRSNSFKFQRGDSMGDSTPLDESDDNYLKIFEEYSFPVDLVVRRRGRTVRNSFDELEDVTISDEYCDPSDFKAYCQPGDESVTKLYTAPDPHDYTQPCPDTEPPSSEEENDYEYIGVPDDTLWSRVVEECPCPDSAPPVRGPEPPSPVYENVTYIVIGDRAPFRSSEAPDWPHSPMAQHWISFLRERQTRDRSKKDKREGHGVSWLRRLCHRSHSDGILHKNELDRSLQRSEECLEKKASEPRGRVLQRSQSVAVETDRGQGGGLEQVLRKESRSLDAILEDEGSSGKSNQLYETAFESTAGPVEAGMQDELLNHPVLHMSPDSSQSSQADPAACGRGQAGSRSEQLRKLFADRSVSRGSSASDLSSPSIVQKVVNESSKLSRPTEVSLKRSLPIDTTLSTPSPPSTAPLPIKFRDKKFTVIRSTPNLCSVPAGPKGAESPMSIDMNHIIRPVIPSLEEHRVPMTSRVTLLRQNRPVSTSSSTLSSLESLRSTKSDESSVSRPISGLSSDSSCSSLNNSLLTTPPVKPPRRSLLGTREADRYRHKKPSPIIEDVSREVESEVRNFPGFEADSCPEGIKRSASRSLIGSLVTNWDSNKDVQGSDSGISVEFQQGPTPEVFSELALDRLRRKVALIDKAPSEEDTDVDNLPFDMPKLRRRRNNSLKTELSVDRQMGETDKPNKTSLTLSFSAISPKKTKTGLQLNLSPSNLYLTERIDLTLPLERQGWYHGAITRVDAENLLRVLKEGSYLVRNSESSRQGYSLSLKSVRGFMHMRIVRDPNTDKFILGQFSKPFENIPEMIVHYSRNKLPIKGAEHMSLVHPVVGQLL